jgi:flavodoxin I
MFTKHLVFVALCLTKADAFAFVGQRPTAVPRGSALSMSIGLYYSTSTGNTETVSEYIAAAAGGIAMEEISTATPDQVQGHDALIVGAPTWHTGADEQRSGTSWDSWLYDTLPKIDLKDKKVAIFGVGDQQSYGDNFCDAAGELYDLFSKAGCKVYGMTTTDGYEHSASKAERSGKFVG